MKSFELNGLGRDWIYTGETAEEACKQYLEEVGAINIAAYEKYCEDVGVDARLDFEEIK